MRFKLDENLDVRLATLVAEGEHDHHPGEDHRQGDTSGDQPPGADATPTP